MSNPYGYNPKIAHPNSLNNNFQMQSASFQKPFYFGGSQVPYNLQLNHSQFSGAGFIGDQPPKNPPQMVNGKPINRILVLPVKR